MEPPSELRAVLVAADSRDTGDLIKNSLKGDYRVDFAQDKATCLEMFKKRHYEFVFIDLAILAKEAGKGGYLDFKKELKPFWEVSSDAEIMILSPPERIRETVSLVKAGASNYLTYPINPDEVRYIVESAYEFGRMKSELDYLRDRFWQPDSLDVVSTRSPVMKKVFERVRMVAPTRATILLTGETGTGKGVIAQLTHSHSSRRDAQFISVHCGAIPETLIESELFGHEKGAFTGAFRRKLGKFEIASGGTIFLDEIGTIPGSAQIKLLQVLQERNFHRVGGEKDVFTDVRVIAASNMDLKGLCNEGLFRKDLYYRLNVFPIEIPPLRERMEDIPLLVEVFLKRLNKLYFKDIHDVSPQVMEAFKNYFWPGNIRELENLLERAYILETSTILTQESFPGEFFEEDDLRMRIPMDASLPLKEVRKKGVQEIEKAYLKELLTLNKGRIGKTAQAAQIGVRQLHKLLSKYGLKKEDFRR